MLELRHIGRAQNILGNSYGADGPCVMISSKVTALKYLKKQTHRHVSTRIHRMKLSKECSDIIHRLPCVRMLDLVEINLRTLANLSNCTVIRWKG